MKTKNTVAKKGALSNPRPSKNTLSKGEVIDIFERYDKTVDLAGETIGTTLPVLMLLCQLLNQDEPIEDLVLHLNGRDVSYCNTSHGILEILQWVSGELHECWNEIDGSHIHVALKIDRYLGRKPFLPPA